MLVYRIVSLHQYVKCVRSLYEEVVYYFNKHNIFYTFKYIKLYSLVV